MLDLLPISAELMDAAGRLVHVNPAFEQLTGFSLVQACGHTPTELLHSVAVDEDAQQIDPEERTDPWDVIMAGRTWSGHARIRTASGGEMLCHVQYRSVPGEMGQPEGILAIRQPMPPNPLPVEDMPLPTAQLEGLQLVETNEAWRLLFEPEVGEEATDPMGSPVPQPAGGEITLLIASTDRDRVRSFLHDPSPQGIEVALHHTEGGPAIGNQPQVALYARPLPSCGGPPKCTIVALDLRARLRAEQHNRAEVRMGSIGTLAAGMAHEINNPLTYALGNLDMADAAAKDLLDGGATDGAVAALQQALADARGGVTRVRNIIRDMKTLSRLSDDDPAKTDVRTILDSTLKMVHQQLSARGTIQLDYRNVPRVLAHEARLGQVFLNLITNAIQALEPEKRAQNQVRIVVFTDAEGSAVIEIQDNGVGIDPEHLASIFDPFFTTREPGDGTGLGLSICHTLVAEMKGRIEVESAPGHGSVARVVLPPADELDDENTMELKRPLVDGSPRRRILVIDDEPLVLRMLKKALRQHDVVATTQGAEALEHCREQDFDLILSDLMMAGIDGVDLYGRLMEFRPDLAARVVFMTGGAFTPRTRDFLSAIPNRCIEKPFEAQEVLGLLERMARRHG
jgi:PAS domain S-box-containing protein